MAVSAPLRRPHGPAIRKGWSVVAPHHAVDHVARAGDVSSDTRAARTFVVAGGEHAPWCSTSDAAAQPICAPRPRSFAADRFPYPTLRTSA